MELDMKALSEATSGAVGGVLSTTILYPLDTCKTKYQAEAKGDGTSKYRNLLDVLREAVSCGNIMSLYQGLGAKNGHAVFSGFVYFYSYSYIRTKYLEKAGVSKMGTLANLVVAAAAGACTACATQPLDTLSSRMQTSNPGKAKGLFELFREGGIKHAFDGLGISLILTINPAIQYTVFEQLKNRVLERQASKAMPIQTQTPAALSAISAFVLGAISKCVATVLTYPLIRCKVMMQRAVTPEEEEKRRLAGGDVRAGGPPTNMAKAFAIIWHAEGVPGLYKGLEAQILKTVLSAALMLMIKEQVSENSRKAVLSLHRLLTTKRAAASQVQAISVQGSAVPASVPCIDRSNGSLSGPKMPNMWPPSIRVIPFQVNDGSSGASDHHVLAADAGSV